MNGLEFLAELSRRGPIARTPVLVMSANAHPGELDHPQVVALLRKPFELDELLRWVEVCTRVRSARRADAARPASRRPPRCVDARDVRGDAWSAEGPPTLHRPETDGDDPMPIIQCDIREGRTPEQKRALAEAITRVVHETIDAPIEYIYVLIRETPGSHHVKAGKPLPDWTPPRRTGHAR